MYCVLQDGVSLGTYTDSYGAVSGYFAENSNGETFTINKTMFNTLRRLDGKRPPNLSNTTISDLRYYNLIRTSRLRRTGILTFLLDLFPIGSRAQKYSQICTDINAVLPIASAALLAAGMILRTDSYGFINIPFVILLTLVGIFLHECGHIIAGIANGVRIDSVGILTFLIIPIGAAIRAGETRVGNKYKDIQFILSGVEMNILYAGILYISTCLFPSAAPTLSKAAFVNVILAVTNLIPAWEYDGEKILSIITGTKSIKLISERWIHSKKFRRKVRRCGKKGLTCAIVISITAKLIHICLVVACIFIIAIEILII